MDAKVASRLGAAAVGIGMALAAGSAVASAAPDSSTDSSSSSPGSSTSDPSSDHSGPSSKASRTKPSADTADAHSPTDSDDAAGHDTETDSSADEDDNQTGESVSTVPATSGSADADVVDDVSTTDEIDSETPADVSPIEEEPSSSPAEDSAADAAPSSPEIPASAAETSDDASDGAVQQNATVALDDAPLPTEPPAPAAPLNWFAALLASIQRDVDYFFRGAGPAVIDPRQLAVSTFNGVTIGTFAADGDDRDWLTYKVTEGPKYGTVVINRDGTYVYTPTGTPTQAIEDTFTVEVRNFGFNLRSLRAVFNPALNTSTSRATVSIAASAPTQPGDNGIRPIDYYVHNYTTKPVTLTARTHAEVILYGPAVGSVLLPGQSHRFQLAEYTDINTPEVVLTYENGAVVTLGSYFTALPYARCSDAASSVTCTGSFDSTEAVFLDSAAGTYEIKSDFPDLQAAILNGLCVDNSLATCKLVLTNHDNERAYGAPQIIADLINASNVTVKQSIDTKETVSVKDSLTTVVKAAGKITGIVSAEIQRTYGREMTESVTLDVKLSYDVPPMTRIYMTRRPSVIRHTADFTLRLGNTTWILRGVTVDEPDPTRSPLDQVSGNIPLNEN